jgi:hypothetical protein
MASGLVPGPDQKFSDLSTRTWMIVLGDYLPLFQAFQKKNTDEDVLKEGIRLLLYLPVGF